MPILLFIADVKDGKLQSSILKYYAKYPKVFSALREICRNVIKGNAKMNKYKRQKLLNSRKVIYSIAYDKFDRKQKRNKIIQTGNFSWIFPIVAGLLNLL